MSRTSGWRSACLALHIAAAAVVAPSDAGALDAPIPRAWQAELRRAVKGQLRTPSSVVSEGRSLCTVIRFEMFRGGVLGAIGVSRASPSADWDVAVVRAVQAANPLPPPPEGIRDGARKTFKLPIVFAGRDGVPNCR